MTRYGVPRGRDLMLLAMAEHLGFAEQQRREDEQARAWLAQFFDPEPQAQPGTTGAGR